ncbi:MAG: hypothetical protein LBT59_08675 [Clostridiales bacterium]|nr:hypothetical protein [Clostridiales bacterium]
MEKEIEVINWSEFDKIKNNGAIAVGEIRYTIKLLLENKGKSLEDLKEIAMFVSAPIALAREIVKQKTVDEAFELWRMTNLKYALKATMEGVDIEQVKAETELSMSALKFLIRTKKMPEKGRKLEMLKKFAYTEDYFGELNIMLRGDI